MAFGELVSLLKLNTTEYEKELKRITDLTRREMAGLTRQSIVPLHSSVYGGSGTGYAQGSQQSFEAQERKMRRFYSQWDQAIVENEKRKRAELERSTQGIKVFRSSMIKAAEEGTSSFVAGFKQVARVIGAAGAAAGGISIVGGMAALVKHSIDLNEQWETNRIGIATVLQLTTRLVDAHGKLIPATKQWSMNINEAERLMERLRISARGTFVTAEELTNIFKSSLGFATSARMTTTQAADIIGRIANVATVVGARGERETGFEEKALLTGQFIQRSRIGRVLGLSSEEIQKQREAGHLFDFLNQKLAAAQMLSKDAAVAFRGAMTTLISNTNRFIQLGFQDNIAGLKNAMVNLNKVMTEENIKKWATQFSDGIKTVQAQLEPLGETIRDIFVGKYGLFTLIGKLTGGAEIGRNIRHALEVNREMAQTFGQRTTVEQRVAEATRAVEQHQSRLSELQRLAQLHGGEQAFIQHAAPHSGGAFVPQADIEAVAKEQFALDRAAEHQKRAMQDLEQAHLKSLGARINAEEQGIHRISLLAANASEKKKKQAETEAEYLKRLQAKGHDDEIERLHGEMSAALEAAKRKLTLGDNFHRAEIAIREQFHQKVLQEQEKEQDQYRDFLQERQSFFAEKLDQQLNMVRAAANKEIEERRRAIRDQVEQENITRQQGEVEFARERAAIIAAANREIAEKQKDFYDKENDLRRDALDKAKEVATERKDIEAELQDRIRTHQREQLDMDRQLTRSKRELGRATEDAARAGQEVALNRQQRALQGRVEQFLRPFAFNLGRNPVQSAMAQAALHRLAGQVAGGDLAGLSGAVREASPALGLRTQGFSPALGMFNLLPALRGFALQGAGLGEQRFQLGLQGEETQDQRRLQDAQAAVNDARQGMADLSQKQRDLSQKFADATRALRDKFTANLDKGSEALRHFNDQLKEITKTARGLGQPVAPGLSTAGHALAAAVHPLAVQHPLAGIRPVTGSDLALQAIRSRSDTAQAHALGGQVNHFHPGSIVVNATDPRDFANKLGRVLETQARTVAPARR